MLPRYRECTTNYWRVIFGLYITIQSLCINDICSTQCGKFGFRCIDKHTYEFCESEDERHYRAIDENDENDDDTSRNLLPCPPGTVCYEEYIYYCAPENNSFSTPNTYPSHSTSKNTTARPFCLNCQPINTPATSKFPAGASKHTTIIKQLTTNCKCRPLITPITTRTTTPIHSTTRFVVMCINRNTDRRAKSPYPSSTQTKYRESTKPEYSLTEPDLNLKFPDSGQVTKYNYEENPVIGNEPVTDPGHIITQLYPEIPLAEIHYGNENKEIQTERMLGLPDVKLYNSAQEESGSHHVQRKKEITDFMDEKTLLSQTKELAKLDKEYLTMQKNRVSTIPPLPVFHSSLLNRLISPLRETLQVNNEHTDIFNSPVASIENLGNGTVKIHGHIHRDLSEGQSGIGTPQRRKQTASPYAFSKECQFRHKKSIISHQDLPSENNVTSQFKCISQGYYPDTKNSSKFHICSEVQSAHEGVEFLEATMTCSENSVFDREQQSCVPPTSTPSCDIIPNVDLENQEKLSSLNSRSSAFGPRCAEVTFQCPHEGRFPCPSNSMSYYICIKPSNCESYVKIKMMCNEGDTFDPKTEQCVCQNNNNVDGSNSMLMNKVSSNSVNENYIFKPTSGAADNLNANNKQITSNNTKEPNTINSGYCKEKETNGEQEMNRARGFEGVQGTAQGANDAQGTKAAQGNNNEQGSNLEQGINSAQGANGAQGSNDAQGGNGAQGANDSQGANAVQELKNLQGLSNAQGPNERKVLNRNQVSNVSDTKMSGMQGCNRAQKFNTEKELYDAKCANQFTIDSYLNVSKKLNADMEFKSRIMNALNAASGFYSISGLSYSERMNHASRPGRWSSVNPVNYMNGINRPTAKTPNANNIFNPVGNLNSASDPNTENNINSMKIMSVVNKYNSNANLDNTRLKSGNNPMEIIQNTNVFPQSENTVDDSNTTVDDTNIQNGNNLNGGNSLNVNSLDIGTTEEFTTLPCSENGTTSSGIYKTNTINVNDINSDR